MTAQSNVSRKSNKLAIISEKDEYFYQNYVKEESMSINSSLEGS